MSLFQIGSLKAVIVVDFDESFVEMTDEISEYLSAVDDVLTYYNENGQVKYVSIKLWEYHNVSNYLTAYIPGSASEPASPSWSLHFSFLGLFPPPLSRGAQN